MEMSYSELKCKQVINVVDGKCLGRIIDIVIDVHNCKVLGLVVPHPNSSSWSLFKRCKEVFIPFNCICKIGIDVILVELFVEQEDDCKSNNSQKPSLKDCKCQTYTLKNDDYKVK